jgi:hypothetical protein
MKELTIDLTLAPEERWCALDPQLVSELVEAAEEELYELYPDWLLHLVEKAVHMLTAFTPSHYVREIEGLADHAQVTPERLLLLNLSYDLSACGGALPGMLGCTAGLRRDSQGQLHLARAMDWAFPEVIRDYSTIFRFRTKTASVLTVGFPGCIGALTGVNAHGVAVSLNQAFVPQLPHWAISVPWLVRETLLKAKTFADAKRHITTTRAMSSGFYLVTDGQDGALIESTGNADEVIPCDKLLVVANHFHDDETPATREWGDSHARHARLHTALKRGQPLKTALLREPVEHGYTAHQIVLDPRKRKIEVRCPNSQEPRWETFYVAS